MVNSKLFELCTVLSEVEWERLALYLASRYFNLENQAKRMIQLFEGLRRVIQDEKSDWALYQSKEHFVVTVLGEPAEKVKNWENVMSKLYKVIKSFIVLEYAHDQDDPILPLMTLSRFYRLKGLTNPFQLNMKKLKQLQKANTVYDEKYFKNQYLIEYEIGAEQALYNNRKTDVNLLATFDKLELWHLVQRLNFLIEIYSQKIHTNFDTEALQISPKSILELLQKNPNWNQPLVQVQFQVFQLLYHYNDGSLERLEKVWALLREKEAHFADKQNYEFKSIIRTFAIKKYNDGNLSHLPIVFDIYKQHLAAGYLYQDQKIHASSMINIVTAGLKLNELEWVEHFILDHRQRMFGTKTPEGIVSYCLAHLYFHRKDYHQAIDLLNHKFEDVSVNIATKRLEIKIYFELASTLLEPRLDAFKVYIFRLGKKHLTDKVKTANNNFIDAIRQLIHHKTILNSERMGKIATKIKQLELLADREWLLEQTQN